MESNNHNRLETRYNIYLSKQLKYKIFTKTQMQPFENTVLQ